MKFNREELIAALASAAPALARNASIPGLDHFWFEKDSVLAYDALLGVCVPIESDLEFGLPGRTLMELLKLSAHKEVFLDEDKGGAVLQMGKSKTNLVALPVERSPWQFPTEQKTLAKATKVDLTEEVLAAIGRVSFLRYVGKPLRAVHNGVTIYPTKSAVEFCATDSACIAAAVVNDKTALEEPVVLPWGFVDRLSTLVEPDSPLYILKDCLVARGSGAIVCSNLLELTEAEPDQPKVLSSLLPDLEDFVPVPPQLMQLLDKATVLAGNTDRDAVLVNLEVDGKTLIVSGKYALGSFNEKLALDSDGGQAEAAFRPDYIRRVLGLATKFVITGKAGAFSDDSGEFTYAASARVQRRIEKGAAAEEEPEEAEEEQQEEAPRRRRRAA